jgi:hypothetical protein
LTVGPHFECGALRKIWYDDRADISIPGMPLEKQMIHSKLVNIMADIISSTEGLIERVATRIRRRRKVFIKDGQYNLMQSRAAEHHI